MKKRTAALVATLTGALGLVVGSIASPYTLVVMPMPNTDGRYQWVMKPVQVRYSADVQVAKQRLAEMGADMSQIDSTPPPYTTMKETRWLEKQAGRSVALPIDYHRVKVGKACTSPTRQVTLASYRVPVMAKVNSEGGQIGVYARCISQGGFYSWFFKIRDLLNI